MFYNKILCLLPLLIFASSAYPALTDRGNGLIYDDVLDITWLQDANYAKTIGLTPSGKMSKNQAVDFADNFEFTSQDGSINASNWRLPSILDEQGGIISFESEIGSLLYNTLGNTPGGQLSSSYYGPDDQFILSFSQVPESGLYWFDESPQANNSFVIWSQSGWLGEGLNSWAGYTWLVHDGDIGNILDPTPVPLPASIYFFVAAILSLVLRKTSVTYN